MEHDIAIWFLVLSLIFPRVTLLIAYFSGSIPPNIVPFWGDFFMAVFVPRVLVLIYIITNLEFGVWATIHLIALILVWGTNMVRRSGRRRAVQYVNNR